MTQSARRQPFTKANGIRSLAVPVIFEADKEAMGADFLRELWFLLAIIHISLHPWVCDSLTKRHRLFLLVKRKGIIPNWHQMPKQRFKIMVFYLIMFSIPEVIQSQNLTSCKSMIQVFQLYSPPKGVILRKKLQILLQTEPMCSWHIARLTAEEHVMLRE